MQVDTGDGLLASLGLKLVNLVVGTVCSFAALRFFDGLTTRDKWSTFIGGVAIASWGAPPITDFIGMPVTTEIAFVIMLAMFGMAFAAEIIKVLRAVDWGLIVKDLAEGITKLISRKP